MKSLVEVLNESINEAAMNAFGFPKDYKLPGSWDLVEIVNGSQTVEEFLNEYNGDGEEYPEACAKLNQFMTAAFSNAMTVELGNWNPESGMSDEDEEWGYFYEETGLKKGKAHGIVTFCDGDDGTFTVLQYAKGSINKKELKDFLVMLEPGDLRYITLEF